MVFSPDGSRLAVWVTRGAIQFLDSKTGSVVWTIDLSGDFVYAMDYSPDGSQLAVATASELMVWDIRSRSKLPCVNSVRGAVAVAYSLNGQYLVSAERDRVVRLRKAETGNLIREFVVGAYQVNSVAFSPDGKRIVTGGADRSVRVWDTASSRELLALPGVTGPVLGVVWDRTQDRILALDDSLRCWGYKEE